MKQLKNFWIVAVAAVLALAYCPNAGAQGRGFDLFGPVRSAIITTNIRLITNSFQSDPIFVRDYEGIAVMDISTLTNYGTNTVPIEIQTSSDTTNYNDLTNYAVGVWTGVVKSNFYYGVSSYTYTTNVVTNSYGQGITNITASGAGLQSTNWLTLPGTPTTPTASTAGFATPYLLPAPFTNSGIYTNANFDSTTEIAWVLRDQGPYVRVKIPGTGTNYLYAQFKAVISGN